MPAAALLLRVRDLGKEIEQVLAAGSRIGKDVIGGRVSLVADDGERENFHRSARALPATRRHAGHITCRYGTPGHSLNSRLCRVPDPGSPDGGPENPGAGGMEDAVE
jgi:hypothetical protein